MKYRCYSPTCRGFHRYGGRGIAICKEWRDSFIPFYEWSLLNGIALGLTIERKDNDADYSPDNCEWATPKKQGNNRSTNVVVEFEGERKTVQQWADSLGITHEAMNNRLKSDLWSLEEALTTPMRSRKEEHPALRKRVSQYSLDGEFINTFESVTAAAGTVGAPTSNISRALTGGYTSRGYYWKYADES
jgi:hypothetical protein